MKGLGVSALGYQAYIKHIKRTISSICGLVLLLKLGLELFGVDRSLDSISIILAIKCVLFLWEFSGTEPSIFGVFFNFNFFLDFEFPGFFFEYFFKSLSFYTVCHACLYFLAWC